jgi:hypothetical protein
LSSDWGPYLRTNSTRRTIRSRRTGQADSALLPVRALVALRSHHPSSACTRTQQRHALGCPAWALSQQATHRSQLPLLPQGRCTATRPTAARRVPTANRRSTDPKSVQQAVRPPQATQRMSAQRRYLLCQLHQLGPWHLPHPAPCSSRALLLPTLRCLPSERPQRRRRLRAAAHSQSGASRTAWQSVSHRSVAGGGCTPQIPHPHLLRLGRLELLQMPAHSRISAAHRPTCATQQHDRCYSETTHTQRNTTRPRDAPKARQCLGTLTAPASRAPQATV